MGAPGEIPVITWLVLGLPFFLAAIQMHVFILFVISFTITIHTRSQCPKLRVHPAPEVQDFAVGCMDF